MRLIANWQQCWRWISWQCATATAALSLGWETMLPADMKTAVLAHWYHWIVFVLGVIAAFGRLINQTPPAGGTEQKP